MNQNTRQEHWSAKRHRGYAMPNIPRKGSWRARGEGHPSNLTMAMRHNLNDRTTMTGKPQNLAQYAKAKRLNRLMLGYEFA